MKHPLYRNFVLGATILIVAGLSFVANENVFAATILSQTDHSTVIGGCNSNCFVRLGTGISGVLGSISVYMLKNKEITPDVSIYASGKYMSPAFSLNSLSEE